jgi:hypothetical protein
MLCGRLGERTAACGVLAVSATAFSANICFLGLRGEVSHIKFICHSNNVFITRINGSYSPKVSQKHTIETARKKYANTLCRPGFPNLSPAPPNKVNVIKSRDAAWKKKIEGRTKILNVPLCRI